MVISSQIVRKFKKSGVDIKGLTKREFAKMPILGQPVELRPLISDHYFLTRS